MRVYKKVVLATADSIAPAANAVIADTGALPEGVYDIDIAIACADTAGVGKGIVVQHRNAANSGNTQVLGGTSAACSDTIHLTDYMVAANERIRACAMSQAPAALSEYVATIHVKQSK